MTTEVRNQVRDIVTPVRTLWLRAGGSMRESEEIQTIRRDVGHQLSVFRRAAGLTQRELAAKTYCHRTRIAHLERGTGHATERLWRALDDAVDAGGALYLAAMDISRHKLEHQQQENEKAQSEFARQAQRLRQPADVDERAPEPAPDSAHPSINRSQQDWCQVRRHLSRHRTELTRQAADLYDPAWRVGTTPTLARGEWIPARPVPLHDVTLGWVDDPPPPLCTGDEPELRPITPMRAPRRAYARYTAALRYLDPPRLLENRPSYRLTSVETDGDLPKLTFGPATYFDRLDVSEALSHEFAAAARAGPVSWDALPFRSLFTDPRDFTTRPICPGIITLTLRLHPAGLPPTMLVLSRDARSVAVGGGQYGLTPAGEFQPSSIHPDSIRTDLDLWRNIVREYSEEVVGEPEYDGSSGSRLDYDSWPFYRSIERARASGRVRVYFLGIVMHALSLNAAILTVAVFDHDTFDTLFRDRARGAEGALIGPVTGDDSAVPGFPFDQQTVTELLANSPLGGTARACVALAWSNRSGYLP